MNLNIRENQSLYIYFYKNKCVNKEKLGFMYDTAITYPAIKFKL
jgi:hypothetical protein